MSLLSYLFSNPLMFVVLLAVFLLALSVHEYSHALIGFWLGDPTAKRANRLTLNPLAHIDLLGLLALLTVGFGWGKPVPFNPYNLKARRWGPVLVAFAGPIANLICGTIFALAWRWLEPPLGMNNLLVMALGYAAFLNFLLMLFNLIPLPPLDGSKVLLAALADEKYRRIRLTLETQGPIFLLALIVLDLVFGFSVFSGLGRAAEALFALIVH